MHPIHRQEAAIELDELSRDVSKSPDFEYRDLLQRLDSLSRQVAAWISDQHDLNQFIREETQTLRERLNEQTHPPKQKD